MFSLSQLIDSLKCADWLRTCDATFTDTSTTVQVLYLACLSCTFLVSNSYCHLLHDCEIETDESKIKVEDCDYIMADDFDESIRSRDRTTWSANLKFVGA